MTNPTPAQMQLWNERAAIREYCGGLDREEAERQAWYEVCPRLPYPKDKATQQALFPVFVPYHCDAPAKRE